jgi:hypothetical protein
MNPIGQAFRRDVKKRTPNSGAGVSAIARTVLSNNGNSRGCPSGVNGLSETGETEILPVEWTHMYNFASFLSRRLGSMLWSTGDDHPRGKGTNLA